jgi:hypothetical protein
LTADRRRTEGAGGFFLRSIRSSFWRSPSSRNLPTMFAGILLCAHRIKLVPGRELEPSIGACERSLKTSMEKAAITTTPAAVPSEWRYVNQKSDMGSV